MRGNAEELGKRVFEDVAAEELDGFADHVNSLLPEVHEAGWTVPTYKVVHNGWRPMGLAIGTREGRYGVFLFHGGALEGYSETEPFFETDSLDAAEAFFEYSRKMHLAATAGKKRKSLEKEAGKEVLEAAERIGRDEEVAGGLTVYGGK